MGHNGSGTESVLMSKVYAVTSDGYQYLVDFNGMMLFAAAAVGGLCRYDLRKKTKD